MSEASPTIVVMNDLLSGFTDTVAAIGDVWRCGPDGEQVAVDDLTQTELVALNNALAVAQRRLDGLRAPVAAAISRESRPELGSDSLAKKNGFRNATAFIAATSGSSMGDAGKLVSVGNATAPRRTLTGERMPAKHPHIAKATAGGTIGTQAADLIVKMLTRVALRCSPADLDRAEQSLVDQAPGLTLDQLAKIIARAEAYLDPDGLEPKEEQLRAERTFVMFKRDGMLHFNGKLDPESGAPLETAIKAIVTAEFRNETREDAGVSHPDDPDAPRRTLPQRQADALALIAAHALDCDSDLPLGGATVVVRMTLEQLESGTGVATIDGVDQPISAATARRMAASGGVIPCVLGSDSEILDWGREKRLFTKPQRLALAERDGGCAMCGLDPSMTKAHHLLWWARDGGKTDLSNGVLLCESCHHRIHDNGWEIRIEGKGVNGKVWFIPPPWVDPAQVPRLGGRARFAFAA